MNTDNKWLQQMSVKADYSMKSARKLLQVESNVNTDYSIRGATPLSCYPGTFSARFSSFFSPHLTLFHCFILTGQSTMRCGHFLLHLCYPTCFPSMLSFHLWISLFFTKKSERADCQCSEKKIDTALFHKYWQEISATEHVNTEQCQY